MGPRGGVIDRPVEDTAGDRCLSLSERRVIQYGRSRGDSYRVIGAGIGRDKSVICREVMRNGGPDGSYVASLAHVSAHQGRRRPKVFKLLENRGLCAQIEHRMKEGWSPKLIADTLKIEGYGKNERVSHERKSVV